VLNVSSFFWLFGFPGLACFNWQCCRRADMNQFDLLSAGSWKVGLTALAALFGYNSQLWDLFGTGIGIRIPEPCSPFTISPFPLWSRSRSSTQAAQICQKLLLTISLCLYISTSSAAWRQQSESHRNADLAGFSGSWALERSQSPSSWLTIYGKQALNQRQSRNLGGKTETTAKI